MSEEALQIAEERREEKGKGERERYTQLNAEFQRIVRRNKKAFLSEQCKELEENIRMRKTRSPQESWRYQGKNTRGWSGGTNTVQGGVSTSAFPCTHGPFCDFPGSFQIVWGMWLQSSG